MTTVSSSTTNSSSGTASSSTSSSNSTAASSASSVYNTFLLMLTTQLKNQDPLNPTDTTAFTQEMIGLASVEQQVNTNTDLTGIQSSLSTLTSTNGVAYIGKTVVATGNTENVASGGTGTWQYDLGTTAKSNTLSITNSSGTTVWTGSGDTASGNHTLSWDGKDSSGNAVSTGDYTLTVNALDSSSNAVSTTTSIVGAVNGVDTSSGSTILTVGDVNVPLSNVTGFSS